jgi:toxin ParE1/3/4
MARVVKREAAKRDLIRQWVWYAENATLEVADRFLTAAESTLAEIATHPGSGRPVFTRRGELQGLRRVPIGDGFEKLLLFYSPMPDGVDLVRVLHGSRDLAQILDIDPPSS